MGNTVSFGSIKIKYSEIQDLDLSRLENGIVIAWTKETFFCLKGQRALDFVWQHSPGSLEGRKLHWGKRAWTIHKFVAHPVMKILTFVGLRSIGVMVHDKTIPRPIGILNEGMRNRT